MHPQSYRDALEELVGTYLPRVSVFLEKFIVSFQQCLADLNNERDSHPSRLFIQAPQRVACIIN